MRTIKVDCNLVASYALCHAIHGFDIRDSLDELFSVLETGSENDIIATCQEVSIAICKKYHKRITYQNCVYILDEGSVIIRITLPSHMMLDETFTRIDIRSDSFELFYPSESPLFIAHFLATVLTNNVREVTMPIVSTLWLDGNLVSIRGACAAAWVSLADTTVDKFFANGILDAVRHGEL